MGRGRWRRLLAWLPVHGIATVSSSVRAPVMVVLGPLLAGMPTDYPNQLGAAGRKAKCPIVPQCERSKLSQHAKVHANKSIYGGSV